MRQELKLPLGDGQLAVQQIRDLLERIFSIDPDRKKLMVQRIGRSRQRVGQLLTASNWSVETLASILSSVEIDCTLTLEYDDNQPSVVYSFEERSDKPAYSLSGRIHHSGGLYTGYLNGKALGSHVNRGDATEQLEVAAGEYRMKVLRYNPANEPNRTTAAADGEKEGEAPAA